MAHFHSALHVSLSHTSNRFSCLQLALLVKRLGEDTTKFCLNHTVPQLLSTGPGTPQQRKAILLTYYVPGTAGAEKAS